jgi:3-methyladenine DNA glycosylase AlkD
MDQTPILSPEELKVITHELWHLAEREYQYFAMELLIYNKKVWEASMVKLFEFCIVNKSWWDTVDFIATDCCGSYFKLFPDKISITKNWNRSENMWLQRSSLLFQNKYKEQTDAAMLSDYILHLSREKDFFIRKAIGWCLREYSKTNAAWVIEFVGRNNLSSLSKKEALKNIQV